jgi:hypothetical protein
MIARNLSSFSLRAFESTFYFRELFFQKIPCFLSKIKACFDTRANEGFCMCICQSLRQLWVQK